MIHIRTLRDWSCRSDDDTGGAIHTYPRGRIYSVDDHVGLLAIAEGAAESTVPLNPEQELELQLVTAAVKGDHDEVARILAEIEGEPTGVVS